MQNWLGICKYHDRSVAPWPPSPTSPTSRLLECKQSWHNGEMVHLTRLIHSTDCVVSLARSLFLLRGLHHDRQTVHPPPHHRCELLLMLVTTPINPGSTQYNIISHVTAVKRIVLGRFVLGGWQRTRWLPGNPSPFILSGSFVVPGSDTCIYLKFRFTYQNEKSFAHSSSEREEKTKQTVAAARAVTLVRIVKTEPTANSESIKINSKDQSLITPPRLVLRANWLVDD